MVLLTKDQALEAIILNLKEIPRIKSVILFGSKAGSYSKLNINKTDYDLFVVVPFVLVPLCYNRLKRIENKLNCEFDINASINPLPLYRLKRAKGNLLFFKMKNEGMTVFGKDYLNIMDVGTIQDVDSDELFTYYFSSVRFLIKELKPSKLYSNEDSNFFAYNIAKSILYCSEIRHYINGIYLKDRFKILSEIIDSNNLSKDEEEFIELIHFSSTIFEGHIYSIDKLYKYWFLARDYSVSTFELLAKKFSTDLNKPLESYQSGKFTTVKACQYAALNILKKKEFSPTLFLKRISVERQVYACIFYLMISIKNIEEGDLLIEASALKNASCALISSNLIKKSECISLDTYERWEKLKYCVLENWSIACSKSII